MSQSDEIKPEFKTIRIAASSYYKLIELAGMFNVITGMNWPISTVAGSLIDIVYANGIGEYQKLITDRTKLEKVRKETQDNIQAMWKLTKDLRIRE